MYIVHLTTELAPIAKVGGLGDVTAGLSKALIEAGEKVEVIIPFYDHIDRKKLKNLKVDMEGLISYEEMNECKNTIWSAEYEEISLLLIEPHEEAKYFKRGVIYGEEDDLLRFTYFTRAAMEYLLKKGKYPDILNLHDWLTTLAAPLYHEMYKSLGLKIGGIITTIHNMKYQGICSPEKLGRIGLHTEHLIKQDKLQDQSKPEKLNLLKGGLNYSDFLTTVSPTYAIEIQGKEGFGLESILVKRKEKLRGILNGIDTSYWNPETDPFIEKNYPSNGSNLDEVEKAKIENRKALYSKLKMDYDPALLFTCISRIVQQKGPEMIRFGIEYVLKKGGQFILLGSTPEPKLRAEFQALAEEYRDNPHVHFHFLFDEKLAHLTYAAADCILIPSLFEPCGLTQMIALRYGTIPIVHKVGGLNDTVFDIDNEEVSMNKRNGYTFDFPSNDSLRWSIDRAFEHHKNDLQKWRLMQMNGFKKDWSWKEPAQKYLDLYQAISSSKPA
ncbi:MAG: glycogen synthase [Simkaniaceae bacterium]|jgi:starch synthase|nr:MAG: glycogen synthase [Simkaniaceae bacterium]